MDIPKNEIIFVTEASDNSIHLARTCIYTFTKENPWFDGTIVLLSHADAPLSTKSLNQLISIYPKIEIKLCNADPVLNYIISNNTRFKNNPDSVLDILKLSLFGIKNKILYSSRYNVFLKPTSVILIEDSISLHYSGLSIFYKDSNIVFDESQVLGIISNIPAPITISIIESTILSFIEENGTVSVIPEHYNLQSTSISDKKYNSLANKVKTATVIYFNSIKNKTIQFSKIDRLWQFMNKSSTRLINRPVSYTNKEVTNMKRQAKANAAERKRKGSSKTRLSVPLKPKIGATYTVFDGAELLEKSIAQIREHVDYICVMYQTVSWFGLKITDEDLDILYSLRDRGIIDELCEFKKFKPIIKNKITTLDTKYAKVFEREKRNHGLSRCLKAGCSYYICLDVDEFYISEEFKKAKDYILNNNIHYSACKFVNYVLPTLHRGYDNIQVPFISRITQASKNTQSFFVPTDPTRGVYTPGGTNQILFGPADLTMHHMETLRKDIYRKYVSTTRSKMDRSRLNDLTELIKNTKTDSKIINFKNIIYQKSSNFALTECEDVFGIDYENW